MASVSAPFAKKDSAVPHTTHSMISGRGALLTVLLMLLAPLAAVVTTAGPAQAGPAFEQPAVGECRAMSWDEYMASANKEAPIECSQRHTSRVIAVERLPKGVTWDAPLKQLNRIAVDMCDPAWKNVLGSTYRSRAMTAYTWAWFIPSRAQRDRGARWIRCDLVLLGGKSLVRLPNDNEPALSAEPHPDVIADCLKARTFMHTSCSRTHAWRATGTFVLRQDKYPSDRQVRRAAINRCPALTNTGSFAWRFRNSFLWRRGDHVVVCFSHRSN